MSGKNSEIKIDWVEPSALKGKKVDALEVIGEDVGQISASRAQQILKKKGKKYEALINCLKGS